MGSMRSSTILRSPLRWLILCLLLLAYDGFDGRSALVYAADGPSFKRSEFHDQLQPVLFFEDSDVVLTTNPRAGILWRSKDAGASWDRVELEGNNGNVQVAWVHPYSKEVAVVLGNSRRHWATTDRGKSWHAFETELDPAARMPLSFHGSDGGKIILNTETLLESQVVYTTDAFKKAPKIMRKDKGAVRCIWVKERPFFTSDKEVRDERGTVCIVPGNSSPRPDMQRLMISDDFFDKDEHEPGLEDGNARPGIVHIVSASKYLLAVRRPESSQELALYTSNDADRWSRAVFGQNRIEAGGFTVMESTNYSIQIDLLMTPANPFLRNPMGVLFTSDSSGKRFKKNAEFTNRNDLGFVDFEKVESIQGVALANVVRNGNAVLEGTQPKQLVSKITFDDGRTYMPLQNRKGEELHLHSFSEMHNQGKVFSSKAPGLIMGVGNTGKSLGAYEKGDLWVSKNAGVTWFHALLGPHKYEFGGQGSVMVAVYDDGPTNKIMYSFDYGENWKEKQLGEQKFRPITLTTMGDATSLKFILTASPGNQQQKWGHAIYSIDFSTIDRRKCGKSDLEDWYARVDKDNKPNCVMGHKQHFTRRKPDADCFVKKFGEEPLPQNDPEHCNCSNDDFECDVDFMRDSESGECVLEPSADLQGDKCAKDQETYKGPSGYRLIAGNTCHRTNPRGERLDDPIERNCQKSPGGKDPDNAEIVSEITEFEAKQFREYYYLETETQDDETVVMTTGKNQLWVSHDHGKTWKAQLKTEDVVAIYPNRYFHDDVYFITRGNRVYYSGDRVLDKIHSISAPSLPNSAELDILHFHPSQRNWMIWTGCAERESLEGSCDPQAWVSRKGGIEGSWKPLLRSVGNCDFMFREERPETEDLIYCLHKKSGKNQLLATKDEFEHEDVLFDDMLNFATMSEFIVVARRDEADREFLKLDSSIDGKTFAHAKFPPKFDVPHESAYTVLDSSTHAIFLHVTVNEVTDQEYGTILKSNSNGTSYVRSVSAVNRNREGYVDFEKFLGFEGAALVNIVNNIEDVKKGSRKTLKTLITHNDGADWNFITPPKENADGKKFECVAKGARLDQCSLHLHGFTERRNRLKTYSSPTAIGMVIGVGNVGDRLGEKDKSDTFVSRDGGITWRVAAKGQYMWEFGDQGSIIVMVAERSPTREVLYSRDEGKTWQTYVFAKKDIVISDLTTLPSDTSRKFLLWGNRAGSGGRAVTIHLDFTALYTPRQCVFIENNPDDQANDYYLWSPQHPMQDTNCLFGHVAEYHRKKLDSPCYNGIQAERFHGIQKDCKCTRQDFECDYNYERQRDGSCKLISGLQPVDPKQVCRDDPDRDEYYASTGYRRIPTDTCKGGLELELTGEPYPCPEHEEEFKKKHGVSGAALFFAIVIPITLASAFGYFVWQKYGQQRFGAIRLGDGAPVSLNGSSGHAFLTSKLDSDSPWLAYPVMAISGVAAAVMALPILVASVGRSLYSTFAGRNQRYTSRSSLARGRGLYSAVSSDEADLLGEDSDDET